MALTLGGFGFSAYLTYREVFTIHEICEWCVSSAVIMTILMCLSVWRFLRGDAVQPAERRRGSAAGSEPARASGEPATAAAAAPRWPARAGHTAGLSVQ